MKKTTDQWDFGKDNTGDITAHTNLMYYIDMYKDVDMVVGDCGVGWTPDMPKDVNSYQLLYALLLPRIGGNFIMKLQTSGNVSSFYISMLYVTYSKYDNIYIFKSSRNKWSPEIYIVGIGFKGIDKQEKQNLINISRDNQRGNISYPIDNISADFCSMYQYYLHKLIKSYSDIKKFFVYLTRNPEKYNEAKQHIVTSIHLKNKKWLDIYMNHIPNIVEKYYKTYKIE